MFRNLSTVVIAVFGIILAGCRAPSLREEPASVGHTSPAATIAQLHAFTAIDLSAHFNLNATRDFDGWENAYPRNIPSGKQTFEGLPAGLVFQFAEEAANGNAVAANSQLIEVEPGEYSTLYLVAAATEGSQVSSISLLYGEEKIDAEITVTDWCETASHGEAQIAVFKRVSEHEARECKLFAQAIRLDKENTLTGIALPKNTKIKIFAATLAR